MSEKTSFNIFFLTLFEFIINLFRLKYFHPKKADFKLEHCFKFIKAADSNSKKFICM